MAGIGDMELKITADISGVKSALDAAGGSTEKFAEKVKVAFKGTDKSFTDLGKNSNTAGFALTNLGRVAQDLPFGFIGIQNNINPLIESFQRLRKESGSNVLAFKSLVGSLAGAGGIGLAVSLATSALTILTQQGFFSSGKAANTARDEIKKFNEELTNSRASGIAAGLSLQGFVDIAKNQTLSLDTRNDALEKANKILGDHGDKLTLVNVATAAVTAQINKFTEATIQQALATKFADRAADLLIKQADATNVLITATKALEAQRKRAFTPDPGGGAGRELVRLEGNANDAAEALGVISTEITNIRGALAKAQLTSSTLFGDLDGADKITGRIKQLQAEIKKLTETRDTTLVLDVDIFRANAQIKKLQDELDRLLGKEHKVTIKETVSDVLAKLERQLGVLKKEEIDFNVNKAKEKVQAVDSAIKRLIDTFKKNAESPVVLDLQAQINLIELEGRLKDFYKKIRTGDIPKIAIPFEIQVENKNRLKVIADSFKTDFANALQKEPFVFGLNISPKSTKDFERLGLESFLSFNKIFQGLMDGKKVTIGGLHTAEFDKAVTETIKHIGELRTKFESLGTGIDLGIIDPDKGLFGELNKQALQAAIGVATVLKPAIDDFFDTIASGSGNAFSSFAQALGGIIKQLTITVIKALALGAVIAAITGKPFNIGKIIGGSLGLAEGGHVKGPGTKTSDSIPARLSAGEYVIKAASVDKFGVKFFDSVNAGKLPKDKFQSVIKSTNTDKIVLQSYAPKIIVNTDKGFDKLATHITDKSRLNNSHITKEINNSKNELLKSVSVFSVLKTINNNRSEKNNTSKVNDKNVISKEAKTFVLNNSSLSNFSKIYEKVTTAGKNVEKRTSLKDIGRSSIEKTVNKLFSSSVVKPLPFAGHSLDKLFVRSSKVNDVAKFKSVTDSERTKGHFTASEKFRDKFSIYKLFKEKADLNTFKSSFAKNKENGFYKTISDTKRLSDLTNNKSQFKAVVSTFNDSNKSYLSNTLSKLIYGKPVGSAQVHGRTNDVNANKQSYSNDRGRINSSFTSSARLTDTNRLSKLFEGKTNTNLLNDKSYFKAITATFKASDTNTQSFKLNDNNSRVSDSVNTSAVFNHFKDFKAGVKELISNFKTSDKTKDFKAFVDNKSVSDTSTRLFKLTAENSKLLASKSNSDVSHYFKDHKTIVKGFESSLKAVTGKTNTKYFSLKDNYLREGIKSISTNNSATDKKIIDRIFENKIATVFNDKFYSSDTKVTRDSKNDSIRSATSSNKKSISNILKEFLVDKRYNETATLKQYGGNHTVSKKDHHSKDNYFSNNTKLFSDSLKEIINTASNRISLNNISATGKDYSNSFLKETLKDKFYSNTSKDAGLKVFNKAIEKLTTGKELTNNTVSNNQLIKVIKDKVFIKEVAGNNLTSNNSEKSFNNQLSHSHHISKSATDSSLKELVKDKLLSYHVSNNDTFSKFANNIKEKLSVYQTSSDKTYGHHISNFTAGKLVVSSIKDNSLFKHTDLKEIYSTKENFNKLTSSIQNFYNKLRDKSTSTSLTKEITLSNKIVQSFSNFIEKISETFSNKLPGYNTGGFIQGRGSKTSDSIVARVSQGEYIIKAAAVDKYGVRFLDRLNAGSIPSNVFNQVFATHRNVKNFSVNNSIQKVYSHLPRFAGGGLIGTSNAGSTAQLNGITSGGIKIKHEFGTPRVSGKDLLLVIDRSTVSRSNNS